MSVRIETPVFVSIESGPSGRLYTIRPLFLLDEQLVGRDRTFEKALRVFGQLLRKRFLHFTTQRSNTTPLLWLAFNPELQTHILKIELSTGTGGMRPAEVTAVMFDHGDHRYVCLPRFRGHVLMMPRNLRWDTQVERVEEEVNALLREIRRELAPDRPDIERYTFHKGDFVTTVPASLGLRRGSFAFDPGEQQGLFAALLGQAKVNGARELLRVAEDLNQRYPDDLRRTLDPDPHVEVLYNALFAPQSTPVVLVGPPGSGRTTLLHEALALYLQEAEARHTDSARLQHLWLLDPTRVIAGMSLIGAWQRRAEAIFSHLRDRLSSTHSINRADALIIDNPVALCRVGRSAGSDLTLSAVLRPFVEHRQIPVVLEASPTQWQKLEELDRPFADLFQVIRVAPAPRDRALRILIQRRNRVEIQHNIAVLRPALRRLVELDERYPSSRAAPGSLVERLERLVDRFPGLPVDTALVERAFLGSSGMRPEIIDPSRPLTEAGLRDQIESRLIGQPDAVDALSAVIHAARAGIAPPGRPAASMLLVGPTGVGKTEAAKVLTGVLYTTPAALIRLDMNEYVDADAARRLIGDAWQPEGQLTGRIRHQPFCILLLDEIEKAHPSVHDLLLQVLDEGRLTDSLGRVADFSQAIVVLTSNVGARQAGRRLGFGEGAAAARSQAATYRAALQQAFRPEFLNRIDQVVVFGALSQEHIRGVARLQIARLLTREGMLRRTVLIDIAPEVLGWAAEVGFDAQMGARALKRALEQRLVAPIAERLVPLPPDKPILLHADIDPASGGLRLTDEPLPMVAALDRPPLRDHLAALAPGAAPAWLHAHLQDALAFLQDGGEDTPLLTAAASPEGAHVPPEMLLLGEVQEALTALAEELDDEDEDDIPGIGSMALRRSLRQKHARQSHKRARRESWRHGGEAPAQEQMNHDSLRAFVRDLMETTAPLNDADAGVSDAALQRAGAALLQVRAMQRQRPRACCVYLRNLTAAADSAWETYGVLVEAWLQAARQLGTELLVQHAVDTAGRIRAEAEQEDADRLLLLHGFGCMDLLKVEEGIHLFYPPDDPPMALQVLVAAVPEEGEAPLAALLERWSVQAPADARRQGVRLYCPPDRSSDRGAITDLRSGRVVPYADLGRWMEEWMLHALPEDLQPERSPAP